MLVEFNVGNFRSFKDVVTFSMLTAKLKSKNKALDERNVFLANDTLELLKSAAIYGANASGKSNLIQAMMFMRRFVLDSSRETQVTDSIKVDRYRLNTEMETQPAYFEIIFYQDTTRYRYGFTLDEEKIHEEWLYHVPNKRESKLFLREGNDFEISSVFKEGRGLETKTRPNALFLSVVAQFNGKISQKILVWFRNLILVWGVDDASYRPITHILMDGDGPLQQSIVAFIKHLDVGISDINVEMKPISEQKMLRDFVDAVQESLPENLKNRFTFTPEMEQNVLTLHKKYDETNQHISNIEFNLNAHESEGTKKAFYLSGLILLALQTGRVFIIDELDVSLHPLITVAFITLFNAQATNPRNAQLIFTTHDTNLLSHQYFRRDQIWFTEKDKYGATDLYSLAEYKEPFASERGNDASFEKDYIAGKYGAIPFIGNLENLLAEHIDG